MKRIVSAVLAAVMTFTSMMTAFAEGEIIIPEIESGYTITYPEPVDEGLPADVYIPVEEPAPEIDYMQLINIVHRQNGADTEFLAYYDDAYTMSVDDMLSYYFTADEIAALSTSNADYDCDVMKKLLVCFLESEALTDAEKQSIISELNNGVEIYYVLRLYADFVLLDEETKAELDNSFWEYYGFMLNQPAVYGEYEDEIESFAVQNKYYTQQGSNLYIDDDSGNVQYKRTDISIPVKNGLNMRVAVKYDLQDSFFSSYNGVGAPYVDTNPLGSGWLFDVTYSNESIIHLSDGRSLSVSGTSVKNNYYEDIDYLYDETEGKYYVAYLDGTKEYFASAVGYSFQYICKKVDKYGNEIYYDCDTADKRKILKISNSNNELEINISYYDDRTEVLIPDGNKVIYNKQAKTYTYGTPENKTYTGATCVLSSISSNGVEGEHVSFDYELLDCCVYEAASGEEVENDAKAFTVMTGASENPAGEHHTITYTYRAGNNYRIFMPAVHTYLPNNNNASPQKTYSYQTYVGNTWQRCVTINYENNNRRITYLSDIERESTLSKKVGNTYISVEKQTKEYPQYKSHIPEYVETVVYNANGDSITKKYEYTYNSYQQPTSCIYTIDGAEVHTTEYSYCSNVYSSLSCIDWIKNQNYFKYISYTVNTLGDVTEEYIAGTVENQTRKIQYTYDTNNNISKIETKDLNNDVYSSQTMEYSDTYDNAVLTKVTNGAGNSVTYEYNEDTLRLIKTTDGRNYSEQLAYDSYGRVIKETHPDNTFVNIKYWNVDNSIDVANEKGYMQAYYYHHGQVTKVEEGTIYNNVSTYGDTLQTISFDNYGRPVSKSDALGNTTTVEYDVFDRQTKVTYPAIGGNAAGSVQVKYYDVFFEGTAKYSMRMTISQENAVSLEYFDTRGRLVKTAMVNNPSTLLAYSGIDTMTSLPTDTQLIVTGTYTYDNWDRLITQTDGMGRTTSYTYDIFNNVLTTTYGDGTKLFPVNYEYDAAGRLVKMTQGTHITTYTYDAAGRLTKMTDPMGYTETYTYDAAGNVATSKDKNGVTTTYTYDSRNRLLSKTKGGKTMSYTYDSVGNVGLSMMCYKNN